MIKELDRDSVKAKLDAGDSVVLVEALGPGYYESGHLPGAINIPHDQVDELAPTLLPDMNAEIIVYCASTTCRNSELAANRLAELGYTNVADYVDGKADWVEAGLPLEQDTPVAV